MRQVLIPDVIDPIESLRRQLAEAKENHRLIEERESEYVLKENIPMEFIKNKNHLEKVISDLKARVEVAERAQEEAKLG